MTMIKPIPNHSEYFVDDEGNVYSTKNRVCHKLKMWTQQNNYSYIIIYPHREHSSVARLVLEAFVGLCPEGMEACHNDGNPTNNRVPNLRWDTRTNNQRDRIKHGTDSRGEKHPQHKLTELQVLKIRSCVNETQSDVAREFGISQSEVSVIKNNKRWKFVR
jgi:hypothetical protein